MVLTFQENQVNLYVNGTGHPRKLFRTKLEAFAFYEFKCAIFISWLETLLELKHLPVDICLFPFDFPKFVSHSDVVLSLHLYLMFMTVY